MNLNLLRFILDVMMSVSLFTFHLKEKESNVALLLERTCLCACVEIELYVSNCPLCTDVRF